MNHHAMANHKYQEVRPLQILGLGDKTHGQVMRETVELELDEGHLMEDIINYHEHWDWEKFSAEGEF